MNKKMFLMFTSICAVTIFLSYTQMGIGQSPQEVAQESTSASNEAPNDMQAAAPADIVQPPQAPQDVEISEQLVTTEAPEFSESQEYIESESIPEVATPQAPQSQPQPESTIKQLGAVAPEVQYVRKEVGFDESAKRKKVMALVERGIAYTQQNSLIDACHKFTHEKDFIDGELYLFIFDMSGVVLAHGQQSNLLWKNLYNLRDQFGAFITQNILNTAKSGGGWVTYEWLNATKISYVKEIQKDGVSYAIGCGYYPHSKDDAVINLVRGAAAFFNKIIQEGRPPEDGFSPFSYPRGRFVRGDLYLYAIDFEGMNLAHGQRPGLIGTMAWNYRDAKGVYVNREIVKKLKSSPEGIWIEYVSRKTIKRAYAQKVTDATGKQYAIVCGYYPLANREAAVELVRSGYQFVKTHGESRAAKEFSDLRSDDYRFGDLYLVMYDMKGNVLAHGGNPEQINQNMWDAKDGSGKLYVQEIIEKAKKGEGWVSVSMNNSFESIYIEKVDLGLNQVIITTGVYPISKKETMELLAVSAASHLESNPFYTALNAFTSSTGSYVRGDLTVFVFDTNGICYAYGSEYDYIWLNLYNAVDDEKKRYVKEFIDGAKFGPLNVSYVLNGAEKMAYVKLVEKDGVKYVVGSSYYV